MPRLTVKKPVDYHDDHRWPARPDPAGQDCARDGTTPIDGATKRINASVLHYGRPRRQTRIDNFARQKFYELK